MKKLIILSAILSTFLISAETYKLKILASTYKGRIQVENLVNQSGLWLDGIH